MRSWRLIGGIAAALATVGIVGALVAQRPADTDVQGTLNSGLNTTESQPGAPTGGAGIAGGSAARNADDGAISSEPGDEPVVGSPGAQQQVRAALSYVPMEGLGSSQTYRATIDVLGWRDRERRSLDVRVTSAELLGPIDPVTGESTGEAEDQKANRSGYVEGQLLLVSVTEDAALGLTEGEAAEVHLVFVPSGAGAVFWINKVVE